jgi:hypothetical protein
MASSSKKPADISLHCYSLRRTHEVPKAIKELTECAEKHGSQLHIIMDEAFFDQKV